MAAKGYCTTDDIEAFLAVDLTATQLSQAETLIEQAEAYIDGECNRGWLVGAQTDEAHYHPGYFLHLKYAPVASITAITGRAGLGQSEETLTADEDYEVRDLDSGLIYLVSPGNYDRVQVDYTPAASVPAEITRACVELVAAWLQPQLQPGAFGIDSYSLPDLTVKFNRSYNQVALPPTVQAILDRYRYRIHG